MTPPSPPDAAPRYHGARHDLERLVRTNLFVMCPNNSGSTFLKNALATSRHTWNLEREGQHTFGFAGPCTNDTRVSLIWASTPRWIAHFSDPAAYDWDATRRAWYFQATSRSPEASVFVTKAPPFLLIPGLLARAFAGTRFLFMVRNPYAAAEGILRRKRRLGIDDDATLLRLAARHLAACFEAQQRNVAAFAGQGTFFTYETMCDAPEVVERQIRALVPVLDDLCLRQRIPVKQRYDEPLRNMNAGQIARLTPGDVRVLNEVFAPHAALLRAFGYDLID